MYPDSSQGLNKETEDAVYFFTPPFYPLDNFSAHQVEIWGMEFPTAEHAYQWKKFYKNSPDIAYQILIANSPEAVKQISEADKTKQPAGWHEEKTSVMTEILTAKAQQHSDVRDALKRSGKKTIYENSPVDAFWGLGPAGKGQNTVGEIWMKIRSELI